MDPARAPHGHFLERCGTCGDVIRECRCFSSEKPVTWTTCASCQRALVKTGAQPK
jgi:hypothetical protein